MRIRIVTEGASRPAYDAPSATSLLATRHLPRFAGEEKSGTSRHPNTLFLGRINRNPVCVMALKAFIPLAIVAAIIVGLLMPTPGHRKAEATQSQIETIDIKN